MTISVLEKRVTKLEAEIRSLKSTILPTRLLQSSLPTGKHLLATIRDAERDIAAGRVFRGNLRDLVKKI